MNGVLRLGARRPSGLRVLYLCHRLPYPPDKGDRIRAFHEVRALARHHRVHLLSLADGAVHDLRPLEEMCERVEVFPIHRPGAFVRSALSAWRRRPLTLSFFESAELMQRLRSLARSERFDVVVAYCSAMAPYLEAVPGVPAVLDMVDVDSAKWAQYAAFGPRLLRPVYALEARRLQAYEASLAGRFEEIVLATANEARLLSSFAPSLGTTARVSAIPNGVDLDFFQRLDLPKAEHPTLVFTGQMDYFANVDGVVHFAREVFPRLRQRHPDLQFLIVGRSPASAVRALGEISGIHVTGAVGDVRPFLSRSWVFVAPLRIAQGVQNKVLEAMASDLPVVSTSRVLAGLAEGGFKPGRDLLAADEPEAMAQAISLLLDDAGERQRIAENARQRLSVSYRWATNLERFVERVEAAAIKDSKDSKDIKDTEDAEEARLTVAGELRGA
jgi:sugar transferase (PEP-CTERM/EpsH1 system associated)